MSKCFDVYHTLSNNISTSKVQQATRNVLFLFHDISNYSAHSPDCLCSIYDVYAYEHPVPRYGKGCCTFEVSAPLLLSNQLAE